MSEKQSGKYHANGKSLLYVFKHEPFYPDGPPIAWKRVADFSKEEDAKRFAAMGNLFEDMVSQLSDAAITIHIKQGHIFKYGYIKDCLDVNCLKRKELIAEAKEAGRQ